MIAYVWADTNCLDATLVCFHSTPSCSRMLSSSTDLLACIPASVSEGSSHSRVFMAYISSFFGRGAIVPENTQVKIHMSPTNTEKEIRKLAKTFTEEPMKALL